MFANCNFAPKVSSQQSVKTWKLVYKINYKFPFVIPTTS